MNEKEFFDEIKSYKLLANKSLGQNFLVNPDVARKIVDKAEINANDRVLEIGAGLGSLSYFLQKSPGFSELIDIDERMLMFLKEHFNECENIEIKRQNIMKYNLSGFTKIIGNLPYYITSGILEYVLLNAVNAKQLVFMTQKEVYQKLTDKK